MKNDIQLYGKDVSLIFQRLSKSNAFLLKNYNCEEESINLHISKCHEKSIDERCFLVIDADTEPQNVIAFFSLKCSALVFDSNDDRGIKLAPAIEIATFALDIKYQDMRMSENKEDGCLSNYILSYIIDKIINVINTDCCAAEYIVLYSVPNAVEFYKKNRFEVFNQYMVKSRDPYIQNCIPMCFNLGQYNKHK